MSCGADASAHAGGGDPFDTGITRVSAYGVTAIVPHGWVAQPADDASYSIGVAASPAPVAGRSPVPVAQGLIATRVDATKVGAPSDLYYLAAKGPIVDATSGGARCTVTDRRVYADHAPAAITGRTASPGDFVASATGTCRRSHAATRWSYFVAAPGFGPAQARGIPGSGLYLILAATPAGPGAAHLLTQMVAQVRFGQDGARDFVRAVQIAS